MKNLMQRAAETIVGRKATLGAALAVGVASGLQGCAVAVVPQQCTAYPIGLDIYGNEVYSASCRPVYPSYGFYGYERYYYGY